MTDAATFDCRTCGACCKDLAAVRDGVMCFISEPDADKLAKRLVRRIRSAPAFDIEPGLAADKRGRCLALRGHIGKRVTCSVYETRPYPCKSFNPGGAGCKLSRREAGLQ